MKADLSGPPAAKRQRGDPAPAKGKGKGKNKRSVKQQDNPEDLRPIVQALTRLVLRHEDGLRGLAMEQDFMFLILGPGTSVVKMMKSTTECHSTPPHKRVLLEELLHRAHKLLQTPPKAWC